ncbi:MAG: sensor histidine kinase [Acidimicrobiia bacterium]
MLIVFALAVSAAVALLAGLAMGWGLARARTAPPTTVGEPAQLPAAIAELEAARSAQGVAERRAAAAEAQRLLLVEAIESFHEGVVVVDANGNEVVRNEAAGQFEDARHADALAAQAVTELIDRARHGHVVSRDLSLFGPPRRVLQLQAVPLRSASGMVHGAAVLIRDVTDAHRIESVRRDFVANVSHELKTPIGALALLAETMVADTDPAVMVQLAERVVREADRLGDMVDDLLDLSLIEAQEAPVRELVPVAVLVSEAVDRVRSAAGFQQIRLVDAPIAAELVVECDRRQLMSALTNLLDNAIKYSDSGGDVEVSATADGARLAIEVRDHGIGIPSRDLERIFERFYRVDRARSRATGGTGLGLSIVRHVARAHGGEVTVESREGDGSSFRLSLPLATSFGATRTIELASGHQEAS